ncbi:MAG: hypothetical protein PF692_14975 [Kiritimatiellae bacterium]|jgi:hypothetical protein|nr:hypothetical protein [Kiritimatiellia bacterium]
MKKVLLVLVLVVLVIVGLMIRPNRGGQSVYGVLPADLMIAYNVTGLEKEMDFWKSLDLIDEELMAEFEEELGEEALEVKLLMENVLGDNFIVAYKNGKLAEVIKSKDLRVQDIVENIIITAKPDKQVTVSLIDSQLSSLIPEIITSEYDGVSIGAFNVEADDEEIFIYYCVVDGVVIATFSMETLQMSIDLATGKIAENFTTTELYSKLGDNAKETDVITMCLDLSSFMNNYIDVLNVFMESEMAGASTNGFEQMKKQLDELKNIYDGFGSAVAYIGRSETEIYMNSSTEFDSSELVPLYKSIIDGGNDCKNYMKYNVEKPIMAFAMNIAIPEYINLILKNMPQEEFSMEKFNSGFEQMMGVSFDAFIACFGNGICLGVDEFDYTAMMPTVDLRLMVGLSDNNAALMPAVLKASTMSQMPVEQKEIAGANAMYVNIPFTTLKPSVAIADNKLVIASSLDLLTELINGVAAEKSMLANDEFLTFTGKEKLISWSYMDITKIIDKTVSIMNRSLAQSPVAPQPVETLVMAEKLKMFTKMYSKSYVKDDEMFSDLVIKYDSEYEPVVVIEENVIVEE